MRKFTRSAVSLLLALVLCACGAGSQWQEQYDLGTRYLDEGNYEEAVIAFTAAIEIDPKRPEAYVGAATAYTALGERQLAIEMLDRAEALLGENDTITAAREELGLSLPLNAYGAIEFTYRPDYVAYEDLSAEEQSWLSTAVSALEAQDKDAILALCGQVAAMNLDCYTTYGQYKVNADAGPLGDNPSIHLELRRKMAWATGAGRSSPTAATITTSSAVPVLTGSGTGPRSTTERTITQRMTPISMRTWSPIP